MFFLIAKQLSRSLTGMETDVFTIKLATLTDSPALGRCWSERMLPYQSRGARENTHLSGSLINMTLDTELQDGQDFKDVGSGSLFSLNLLFVVCQMCCKWM